MYLCSKSFLACRSGGFHHTLSRVSSWGTPGPFPQLRSPTSRCLLPLPSSHRPAEEPQAAGSMHLPPGASGSHTARSRNRCARCSSPLLEREDQDLHWARIVLSSTFLSCFIKNQMLDYFKHRQRHIKRVCCYSTLLHKSSLFQREKENYQWTIKRKFRSTGNQQPKGERNRSVAQLCPPQ